MCLSRNSVATRRNYTKTIPNFVLAEIQLPLIGIFLRQFQILSYPKFNCISSALFYDKFEFSRSRNSIAPHRNYSKTIPLCVLAEVQLPLIENVLRQFQNVSSQNSIALIKIILGQSQIVS